MTYYKFNPNTTVTIEQALMDRNVMAIAEFDKGNKQPLRELHLALTRPCVDRGGYRFDLKDYLKRYWVKDNYHIFECYALNKTDIRKNYTGVQKIIEVN